MTLRVKNPPKPENPRGFYLCTLDRDEIIFQCGPLGERDLGFATSDQEIRKLILTVEKGDRKAHVFHSSYTGLQKGMLVAW